MIKFESLGTSTGKIIYSDDCHDILHFPVETTKELFRSSGILLFRGFGVTYEQMKVFAEQFSSRFTRETNRPQVDKDGLVSLVAEGMNSLAPHSENANTPFRPDAVWFCCSAPAAQGGETLFCDGVRVWEKLSEDLRQLFVSNKIRYSRNFPADEWKHFLGADATLADVKRTLEDLEGINYLIHEAQSISLSYTCSAVVKTKYSNQDAFANNILIEYDGSEESVTFEGGSQLSDAIIHEIEEVMSHLTEEILWQAGDLVMIDNSRFLHGRRAFNDNRRLIFSIFSYLNF
jgi:hypothetical protein